MSAEFYNKTHFSNRKNKLFNTRMTVQKFLFLFKKTNWKTLNIEGHNYD